MKCLKRIQKRSIDDNLRQLVLIRQDRVLVTKELTSLQLILDFFSFYFSKKWVGRAMGNETFYGDGLGLMSRAGLANAITWKNLSPVSRDPGTAIPGSRLTGLARLSCNREVDFYCV